MGVVQFDTTRNKFLAVGDDYTIKVWDMDNVNLLATIDAEGGLPVSFPSSVHRLCFASVLLNLSLYLYITYLLFILKATPRIRFNKEGSLLAVSANDNRIKVLATTDGFRLMRSYENLSLIASTNAPEKVSLIP